MTTVDTAITNRDGLLARLEDGEDVTADQLAHAEQAIDDARTEEQRQANAQATIDDARQRQWQAEQGDEWRQRVDAFVRNRTTGPGRNRLDDLTDQAADALDALYAAAAEDGEHIRALNTEATTYGIRPRRSNVNRPLVSSDAGTAEAIPPFAYVAAAIARAIDLNAHVPDMPGELRGHLQRVAKACPTPTDT